MNNSSNPRAFEVTRHSVFSLVWPIMLASITVPFMGITDTAVVGQLGDAALLGGLAIGAVIVDLIFTGLNFLRSGTVGLTAQALGADQTREKNTVLHRAMLLSLFIGLLLVLLSGPILDIGLGLMKPTEAVAVAVSQYFTIRILAAPFTLLNFSILGWLLGLAQVRMGLALQVFTSSSNIVLSVYLGLIKGGGVSGVAWATVISEVLAAMLGVFMVYRQSGLIWRGWKRLLDRTKIKRTLSLNSDIMIRSFILLFAFSFFTAQGSRLGEVTLAANAVLLNFFLLIAFMLDGFANATEQLVGKAIGARYAPAFDQAVRISLFWSIVLSGLLFLLLMLFGPALIDVLTTNESVRAEARIYLTWAALSGMFGVLAFQMDGVFIGATWSADMRNMMIVSLGAYLLAWWTFMPLWHNHGLWLALEVFLSVRGISLLSRLKTRRQASFAVSSRS
jgi:MATE family multidrug resistance protein